ncbi:MAG: ABC-three component system protein [Undibacterium umbellatum]|uniref:ABC-three component system protein n=1 Tax=Undibacterium umbellatum TaxID=2762300 RepID=UPI003BB5FEA3
MTAEKAEKTRGKRRKTEVPGQALGIGLQYTRLLQLLLVAPEGSFCSMEVLDDVAQTDAQSVKLVQSKSALTANPVSDRAKSLWKTFSNWVTLAAADGCDLERTQFEIYVSRPVTGMIVEAFAKASTFQAAKDALMLARNELWGEAPAFAKRNEVATDIAPFVENVLGSNQDVVGRIICNFNLEVGSGNPQADVETILRGHPISQNKVRDIADHLCGVVKRRVDECLEASKPAVIGRDEFLDWYGAYTRKVDRETVLLSRAKAPSKEESKGHFPRVFVQQLDLIDIGFEDQLEAVSDYLMAAADRTDWAANGEVDATSFDDLDATLKKSWKNKRLVCKVAYGSKSPDEQGQMLYADCMQVHIPLQAMVTPSHFIPGCFHRLADDLQVGWHPDYAQQLKQKKVA